MHLLFGLVAAVLVAFPVQALTNGKLTLEHDGFSRRAIVDVQAGTTDAPLLVVLHGGIGSASMVRRRARVRLDQDGWVVAYPEAIDDWSDGRVYPSGRHVSDVDDVGFLRAMVMALSAQGLVDPARVYVAGPSIGGMMALHVLCEAPDLVAGLAIAIASLPVGAACPDGPARPVLVLHGTEDEIVPPSGGRIGGNSLLIRERGSVRPLVDMMDLLETRNGCTGREESLLHDRAPDDGTRTRRVVYTGCDAPLEHYVVEGAGHTWPGDRPFRFGSNLVGATSQDFSATRVVEAFFIGLDDAR